MINVKQLTHFVFVLFIAAIITAVGNTMDGKHDLWAGFIGILVIAGIATVGMIFHMLPVCNKVPLVFWVSIVGVVSSIPGVPGSAWVVHQAEQVTFLAACTPVLAYAGLSLGKDLEAFRRLSWRIVPVAIAVASGTFICASLLAQITLHLEGLF